MFFRRRFSAVGIDFFEDQVLAVQLKKEKIGKAPSLYRYAQVQVPFDYMQGDKIKPFSKLKILLKKLWKENGFKGRGVNICLRRDLIKLFTVTLPDLPREELAEAVCWETTKYLEVPVEDLVVDYLVLGKRYEEDKPFLDILMATVSREVVEGYFTLLESAGLVPLALEIAPVAQLRVIQEVYRQEREYLQDGNILLLELGTSATCLTITDGKRLLWGEMEYHEKAFFQNYAVTSARQQGEMLLAPDAAGGNISPFFQVLFQGRGSAQGLFPLPHAGNGQLLRHLFITGENSHLEGLASFLASRLKLEPHLLNSLSWLSSTGTLDEEECHRLNPYLTVALGLALRGFPSAGCFAKLRGLLFR